MYTARRHDTVIYHPRASCGFSALPNEFHNRIKFSARVERAGRVSLSRERLAHVRPVGRTDERTDGDSVTLRAGGGGEASLERPRATTALNLQD